MIYLDLYMYYIDMYIISVLDSFWLCIISRSCQGAGGGWDSDDEVRISQVFFFSPSVFLIKEPQQNRGDLEQKDAL